MRAAALILIVSAGLSGCTASPRQPDTRKADAARSAQPTPVPHPPKSSTVDEVLRYPDPGTGPWKQWYSYTKSRNEEGLEERYRLPGDSKSRYYDLRLYSEGEDAGDSQIYNDRHKMIAESNYPSFMGIRKSGQEIFLFFFTEEAFANPLTYELYVTNHGKIEYYGCKFDIDTIKKIYGKSNKPDKYFIEQYTTNPNPAVDFLTASDPDLSRDHCGQD